MNIYTIEICFYMQTAKASAITIWFSGVSHVTCHSLSLIGELFTNKTQPCIPKLVHVPPPPTNFLPVGQPTVAVGQRKTIACPLTTSVASVCIDTRNT